MDDKFKELLRIAFYAGNECHKYAWSINEQFADWYEVNENKLKNLGGGEAETGYALLSDVADLKPCPFCGSEGLLYRDNWRDNKPILKGYPSPFFVKCTNDDCDVVTLDGDTEEQVMFRWDKRV